MERIRTVIDYKNHFKDFLLAQPKKVQDKIFKIIELIEYQERIPEKYLKHIKGQKGLYEARISLASNIWRVFCFFDQGRLVILLNGFQKSRRKRQNRRLRKLQSL